ncbi:MAG: thioesterase [Oscillospiraceae bacterium]|nr:thioesterase [Oscillospiraceae bacterium]
MPDRWFDGTFYKREVTVNYLDCNTERKAFLHYMLGIFSEIAGDESQSKGRTHEALAVRGIMFLITRMSIRIHRNPAVNETLIFRTWFRKAENRFFFRDCDVRSPEGELIASISGTWALIDLAEHRIIDTGEQPIPDVKSFSEKADSPECKKVVPEAPLPVIGIRPVYYTDLDCNYHLNNTAYTRIATDFLPMECRSKDVGDYVVNFNKETKLGDTLEIRGGYSGESYIIQGFVDGGVHFASEFTFLKD